jgi:hypothetical protein
MIDNLQGTVTAVILVLIFMAGDFISGIWASKRVKKIGVQSSKLRWSAAKYAVYCFFIIGTIIIGSFLHLIYCFHEGTDIKVSTYILMWTLRFIMAQMIFITWIEAVSIVENFRLVYPNDTFLKGLHYLLVFDLVKRIPKFANFLKENKCKELEEPDKEEMKEDETD